jgi:copper transport protein
MMLAPPRPRRLAFVLLVLAFVAPAPAALAHASLVSAAPADGATIPQPPASFRLEFNEPVAPLVLRLIAPDGQSTTLAGAAAQDKTVTVAAPPMTQEGTYVLSWRVVSADGHPVGGALVFSLGRPSARAPAAVPETGPALGIAIWAAKFTLYVALFVGVGGAVFAVWIGAVRPGVALYAYGMAAGLVAVALSLPLQGLDALAQPLPDIWRPAVWAAGLRTAYGRTAVIAACALVLGLLVLRTQARFAARALAAAAIAGVGLALAASGHASSAAPRWITFPSVFLHGVAVAFWIGSLLPLLLSLRAGDRVALDRFSRAIPLPLVVLFATGAALAGVQLDRLDALWTTEYGLVLSGKLLTVLALLVLAAWNRFALVPRLAGSDPEALKTSIAIELMLALLILALVGLWRFTPPPRALAAADTSVIHFHAERAMADIEVVPERGRGARVAIRVTDGVFRPVAASEVTLVVWNPAAGIEPVRRAAVSAGGGAWRIERFPIPLAGIWRMRIEILIGDFDKVIIEDNVVLPRAP